jgi:flavin prenyltransferase
MKEKRTLIVVPRETPLSLIHIENMARLAQAGAVIVPAMPGFYFKPKSVEDMVNHLVGRVLDLLKIDNSLFKRWEGISSG